MRVMKFGGTSLATPHHLDAVCDLVRLAAKAEPVVVVTSAPAGVTNLLLELAEGAPCEPTQGPHPLQVLDDLVSELLGGITGGGGGPRKEALACARTELDYVLSEVEGILARCARRGSWDPALKDRVLGAGERLSAHLLASLLGVRGIPSRTLDARELVLTDSNFGGADIVAVESARRIRRRVEQLPPGVVPVIPGFTGGDVFRRSTTLGRGTSDLTASLVAAALSARIVEIWTDVDGIHAEDPSRQPGSPVLPRLDYDQAREMARNGARVLHPRTLDPIQPLAIPLQVRNTLRPEAPGTWVGPELALPPEEVVGREAPGAPGHRPPATASPRGPTPVHLVLAGATGQVAKALLAQLQTHSHDLRERTGFDLRLAGALDSRTHAWSTLGFLPDEVPEQLRRGTSPDWAGLMEELTSGRIEGPVFVDLTASPEVAGRHQAILEAAVPLVTANKLALSGTLADYRRLQAAATRGRVPFRYETTVGAALPVLGTARARHRAGDGLLGVEAALSGTLAFVFARLADGVPFSLAVKEAKELGFTEPDPREDLAGADVGRKLLILLRESGFGLEPEDIPVESLVPRELTTLSDPQGFLEALPGFDNRWRERTEEAAGRGERLVYVAAFQEGRGSVGVRSLPETHPLAGLAPGENLVLFTTNQYPRTPLSISGPGAGPAITASGVLSDILSAAEERYGAGFTAREAGPGAEGDMQPEGRRVA